MSSYDRFRLTLKGSWKEEKLPAAGQVYDLGTHLLDQVVSLFGKPQKVTGFIENVRRVGHPEVDDAVSLDSFGSSGRLILIHFITSSR